MTLAVKRSLASTIKFLQGESLSGVTGEDLFYPPQTAVLVAHWEKIQGDFHVNDESGYNG